MSFFAIPLFWQNCNWLRSASGKTLEKAQIYARKCLNEIEATPQEAWLRPMARLARFIYTRSYEAELDINLDKLEELRALSQDHLLLFLWSHKSHMDSFVFLLSLYQNHFRPLPLIFAGINMNFLGFGALARRVGAIFLRRTFQEDPIYKLVFRRYIDFLIRNRTPLSWSIEGTRSRTGKLSPPKLGLVELGGGILPPRTDQKGAAGAGFHRVRSHRRNRRLRRAAERTAQAQGIAGLVF